MTIRPTDPFGDILPVTSARDLLSGPEAIALLVRHRLSLLKGDWWENPDLGNAVLDLFRENRITEANRETVSALLSSYIRETPGVLDVEEVQTESSGNRLNYVCKLRTQDGTVTVSFEA